MKFLKTKFFNTPDDCDWLRAGALMALESPPFASFVLHGGEDAPARVELYAKNKPAHNDRPIVTYSKDEQEQLFMEPPPDRPTKEKPPPQVEIT